MDAVEGALRDMIEGIKLAPLWSRLAWEQTIARFRRTVLGPFWLSANLLAISFALAVVFGALMGTNYRATFALIISGVLVWTIIGGNLNDSAGVFISAGPLMQSMALPLSFHIFLMVMKNVINFTAQLIALWVVLLVMRLGALPTWYVLPGLAIVLINACLLSLIVAVPSTRFRDINQTVGFATQVLFFLTPVFWAPSQLKGKRSILALLNPFAHQLELVRQPLLGHVPLLVHWEWGIAEMVFLFVVATVVLALYRKRVVFWL